MDSDGSSDSDVYNQGAGCSRDADLIDVKQEQFSEWTVESVNISGSDLRDMQLKLAGSKTKFDQKYRELKLKHAQEVAMLKKEAAEARIEYQRRIDRSARAFQLSEREVLTLRAALARDGAYEDVNAQLRTTCSALETERDKCIGMLEDSQRAVKLTQQHYLEERARLTAQLVGYLCRSCRVKRVSHMVLDCCDVFCAGCAPAGPEMRCPRCAAPVVRVIELKGWPSD